MPTHSPCAPSSLPTPLLSLAGPTLLTLLALTLPLGLSGCGDAAGGGLPTRGQGDPIRRAVPVAITAVTTGRITSVYQATATLEVEKDADVVARVEGIVQAIDLETVEEGMDVKLDQALLRIEPEEYRLRLDLATAKAANLQSKYDRIRNLPKDLISLENLETARSELATARAEEGLAKLLLSYTVVRAPFEGTIVQRHVDVGQKVSLDERLFKLADLSVLLARVMVPSKEFKKLQVDQTVDLVLDSDRSTLNGRVKLVSPTIDPTTGTIKVTVAVHDNVESARPGDFVTVKIVTEERLGSKLVPKSAVLSDKGDRIVFTTTGETAERRVVDVGFTDDVHAEILAGLDPGEHVVVRGQRSLKHGSPLKVLEDPARGSGSSAAEKQPSPGGPSS